MVSLSDKERELVALGASIGAGCELCTQYHVGAAQRVGLQRDEVSQAISEAQAVRCEGGTAVSNVGRRLLDVGQEHGERLSEPARREQALVYIGAAAGCNAGSLLKSYVAAAVERFGLTVEEVQSALEMTEVVKQRAADFLRRDAERALREAGVVAVRLGGGGPGACCGPASQCQ